MKRTVSRALRELVRAWARTGVLPGYCYQAMEWYGSLLTTRVPLASRLPDGSRVECDLCDHVQRHMFFLGAYEPVEAFLFTRLIQPGATVIDAGANVGQYTLLGASAAGPTGRVHSFEPIPRNFDRMSKAVRLNKVQNAQLNPVALWHEPGELQFGLSTEEMNDGSYSVGAATNSTVNPVRARAIRLDDYARDQGLTRVDVIKMDIEGAEWGALQGMASLIERFKPAFLMEVNREACLRMGYDPQVFWDLLVGRFGYMAWNIGLSAVEWRSIPEGAGINRQTSCSWPVISLQLWRLVGTTETACGGLAREGKGRGDEPAYRLGLEPAAHADHGRV